MIKMRRIIIRDFIDIVILDQDLQHELEPGVLLLALDGLALDVEEESLERCWIIFPQDEATISLCDQDQVNIFGCEGFTQLIEDFQNRFGSNNLETVQVGDDEDDIVKILVLMEGGSQAACSPWKTS